MITRRGLGAASIGFGASISVPAVAAPAGPVGVAGRIIIGRDTVIAADVTVAPGTSFDVTAGATLTFTGDFIAPTRLIFTGRGRVDLTRSRVVAARPEWWGAVPDDPAVDCSLALHACLSAHHSVQLGTGDYHLAEALVIDRPNRRIWGVGRSSGFRGTRLLRRGGRGPVVLVGTAAAPATVNAFLWGIDLRWLELGRTAAPESPAGEADDATDTAIGLEIRYVVDCVFEGVRASEHTIGFSLRGAVRTFLRDCSAFRSAPGGGRRDTFVGFALDGRAAPVAIVTGGNASIYLIDCVARTGGDPKLVTSIGLRLTGAMSDTIVERLETTDVNIGILIDGRRDALGAVQRRAGHVDLHIRGAILDQCGDTGIRLTGMSDAALVDIADPYVALAPTGRADCGGNIGVAGGQLLGWTSTDVTATGIRLRATSGVAITGTKLAGFTRPVDAAASVAFELVVGIDHRGPETTGPAIRLTGCSHGYVRPRITGIAQAFECGVAADGGCDSIDVATAGMVPAVLAGGVLVRVDGRAVSATGPGQIYLTASA